MRVQYTNHPLSHVSDVNRDFSHKDQDKDLQYKYRDFAFKDKDFGFKKQTSNTNTNTAAITNQNLQSRFGIIERYAYTESHIGQIPCVCMYVCMYVCDQTPPKPLNWFA